MTGLVRTRVGDFSVETSTNAASLTSEEDIHSALVNPLRALTTMPRIALPDDQVFAVLQGKQLLLGEYSIAEDCQEVAISNRAGVLQGILCRRYDNYQKWSAKRNFHPQPVSD